MLGRQTYKIGEIGDAGQTYKVGDIGDAGQTYKVGEIGDSGQTLLNDEFEGHHGEEERDGVSQAVRPGRLHGYRKEGQHHHQ